MLLALDQGTTSSRAIVFDLAGHAVAAASRPFAQHFPQPGWVEHDPEDLWTTTLEAAAEALIRARVAASDLAAIGIANQRETTLLWDRGTGRAVAPAIVWQDRRTTAVCERLRAGGAEPGLAARTGLRLDPYFSATKLAWLLDHVPGARAAAEAGRLAFGTVDTWLVWRLTGGRVHATDPSNASRTLLFDLRTGNWGDDLLRRFRIPASVLPAIRDTAGDFGTASGPHPLAGVALRAVAGDQQAALFGQACTTPGLAKTTYGTGCFLLLHTGTEPVASHRGLLTTVAARLGGTTTYALEGAVFTGGATIQWLRDGLGLIASAAECDALAATVPDTAGAILVPAFTGLGAPYWDARARGTIVGLTRGVTRAHLCRAALEAIALQVTEVVEAMEQDAGRSVAALRVDGGAARSDLLLALQADFLGHPVERPAEIETTALGAALLAGIGAGVLPGVAAATARWRADRRWEPASPRDAVARKRAEWSRAVERSRDWAHDG